MVSIGTWLRERQVELGLLGLVQLLIALRAPWLLHTPRFWAEEGAVFYRRAYELPWHEALFAPAFGYLPMGANVAAWLAANTVPVADAPGVTTLFSYVMMQLPLVLVIFSASRWWQPPVKKLAFVSCFVLIAGTGEIWLNSINSMNYLNIIPFLMLFEERARNRLEAVWRLGLLVWAGLATPVSCFFLPAYAYLWWCTRERELIHHGLALGLAGAVQFVALFSVGAAGNRLSGFSPVDFVNLLTVKTVVIPLFGSRVAHRLTETLLGLGPLAAKAAAAALAVALAPLLTLLAQRLATRWRVVFAFCYAGVFGLILFGAWTDPASLLPPRYGERYFNLPRVVLLVFTVHAVSWSRVGGRRPQSLVCLLLLVLYLTVGAKTYRRSLQVYGPDWREEVARWEADPSYRPATGCTCGRRNRTPGR
jgi:hypothetical protein